MSRLEINDDFVPVAMYDKVVRERDEARAELADMRLALTAMGAGAPRDAVWLSREDADAIGAAIESVVDQDFLPYPLRDALARLRAARERT